MRLIDANVILRFLTRDDKKKSDACENLFEKAVYGTEELFISDMTVAEVIWVLEKVYKCGRDEIRLGIEKIVNTPNLAFSDKDLLYDAINLYSQSGIDFIDAYHVALMHIKGINQIYSYDGDFDGIYGIQRIEP